MNPNAGRRTAVTGLVSQVLLPNEGPKSTKGKPQYTITLTKSSSHFGEDTFPNENDVNIQIIEGFSEEGLFARSLQQVADTLDPRELQGRWVKIAYTYREGSEFANRTLEAVSETPL